MKNIFSVALLLVATAAFAAPASAQTPYSYRGLGFGQFTGYGFGFGYSRNLYGVRSVPTPPYFALHPPVYYGQRVTMTYGDSPFARLPYQRPSASSCRHHASSARPGKMVHNNGNYGATKMELSQVIRNPYVSSETQLADANATEPVDPKVTINPYFRPPHKRSRTRIAMLDE